MSRFCRSTSEEGEEKEEKTREGASVGEADCGCHIRAATTESQDRSSSLEATAAKPAELRPAGVDTARSPDSDEHARSSQLSANSLPFDTKTQRRLPFDDVVNVNIFFSISERLIIVQIWAISPTELWTRTLIRTFVRTRTNGLVTTKLLY